MNGVDLLILVIAALFGLAGLRQGFVVSVASLVGFVAGGLVGLVVVPLVLGHQTSGTVRSLLALLALLLLASLGQALAGVLGGRLRDRLTWRPARVVDAMGGALVSVTAVLLAAWLLGTALLTAGGSVPFASDARQSRLLAAVDTVMPTRPDRVFSAFGSLLDSTGFPRIYDDLTLSRMAPVDPPGGSVAADPQVRTAADSVLKVIGSAESCQRRIEGSGFVYAPGLVMTNAHVVAGVSDPVVFAPGGGRGYTAQVVVFDPNTDVAVLRVAGLPVKPLSWGATPPRGTDTAVLGYPADGPLTATPARVRGTLRAAGDDIYGRGTVVREVLALRSAVRPGNSGGPVVDVSGRVVGVVFAASVTDPDTGYALSLDAVSAAARAGRVQQHAVPTGECA